MALIVEDGTGLANAESVLSVTELDAWAVKLNWGTAWPAVGVSVPAKEAAARKGTRWIESRYRGRIGGWPVSTSQRLIFPVSGGFVYPDGRTLPAGEWLPIEWAEGTAEAILRAYTGTLAPDLDRGGEVIEETVGPITTVYSEGASAVTVFQEIEDAVRALWYVPGPLQLVRC